AVRPRHRRGGVPGAPTGGSAGGAHEPYRDAWWFRGRVGSPCDRQRAPVGELPRSATGSDPQTATAVGQTRRWSPWQPLLSRVWEKGISTTRDRACHGEAQTGKSGDCSKATGFIQPVHGEVGRG